jgi:hypothetical protein
MGVRWHFVGHENEKLRKAELFVTVVIKNPSGKRGRRAHRSID